MVKRTVTFTAAADGGVTPAIPQFGGVKGEHNATKLVVKILESKDASQGLVDFYKDGDAVRLSFTTGDGTVLSSDLIENIIEESVTESVGTASWARRVVKIEYELPQLLTIAAGQLCVRAVVSRMDESGDEIECWRSSEMVLWFEEASVENGTPFWTGVSEMLKRTTTAGAQAIEAKEQAVSAKQSSSSAATAAIGARDKAQDYAKVAQGSATEATRRAEEAQGFAAEAWEAVNTPGRQGLSAYEVAVKNGFAHDEISWLATLKGETGAQGPQGDKGDTGAAGKDGKDYVLNDADKAEIAGMVSFSYMSLPSLIHAKVGNAFKVYFRNIISLKSALLWVGTNANLTTRYYDDHMTVMPTAEGRHALNWKLYDEAGNILESGTLTVAATAKTASNVSKVLVIGDSTVNAGTMTEKTKALYTADGAKLSLVGTRGTSPNLHEGRGGWTACDYCTKASDGTYDNPFYNNGFDFAYYMQQQGYSGVQAVVIQLGINDVFLMKDEAYTGDTVLSYIDQMVTSIIAYDSNLQVVINLPITPNSNGTSFTEAYGTTQLYWLYNRNSIRFSKDLHDYFQDRANVIVSASNCVLDTKTQINDGVHPTTDGYNALGQRLYEVLISIVDGVAARLLDVSDRAYVVNTSTTINAAAVRDLDTSKCYATTYQGVRSDTSVNDTYRAISADSLGYLSTSSSAGRGVEFPLDLEVGKTYTLTYTANQNNARVYLLKYNADTTYNSNQSLSTSAGTVVKEITPESGYIYSVLFASLVKDVESVWSGISLIEQ